jgi:hypothetical protein
MKKILIIFSFLLLISCTKSMDIDLPIDVPDYSGRVVILYFPVIGERSQIFIQVLYKNKIVAENNYWLMFYSQSKVTNEILLLMDRYRENYINFK